MNTTFKNTSNDLRYLVTKEAEYLVKTFVLNAGLPIDNFIYYDHTNEGSFNWLDYHKKITEEQFRQFCDKANFNSLPQGIKFSLKDLKIQYSPVES